MVDPKQVMRGRVLRFGVEPEDLGMAYLEVTDLGLGREIGPCAVIRDTGLVVDDYVLVSSIGANPDDLAIIGALSHQPYIPADAGGALEGSYPNPTLADGAVDTAATVVDGILTHSHFNALNVDGLAATPSLRTLGLTGTKAMPGIATLDQVANPVADLDLDGFKITELGAGVAATDASTYGQMDTRVTAEANARIAEDAIIYKPAHNVKQPVVAATTANHGLTGLAAVDGVTPVDGDRVLVWQQTAGAANGIYLAASGAWTRALDADTTADLVGAQVSVLAGTLLGGRLYRTTLKSADVLGTTAMVWRPNADINSVGVIEHTQNNSDTPFFDHGTKAGGGQTAVCDLSVARAFKVTLASNATVTISLTNVPTARAVHLDLWVKTGNNGTVNLGGTATGGGSAVWDAFDNDGSFTFLDNQTALLHVLTVDGGLNNWYTAAIA